VVTLTCCIQNSKTSVDGGAGIFGKRTLSDESIIRGAASGGSSTTESCSTAELGGDTEAEGSCLMMPPTLLMESQGKGRGFWSKSEQKTRVAGGESQ
jgi:hypothetical protein